MLRYLCILLALFLAVGTLRADVPAAAPIGLEVASADCTPLECELFADAAGGTLGRHTLLAAALVASGVDDPLVLARHQREFEAWVQELRSSGRVIGTPRARGRAVFEFMHRRILRTYARDATDLQLVFREGRFNCVSASVLFNCLAEPFGLQTCGLETTGHAMSRLLLPEGPLDLETTCARWFQMLDDPRHAAELAATVPGASPAGGKQARREVVGPQIAAMIYYNRGVDLLAEKRFAEALAANAKALRLDPRSDTARGNLLATLNNWAIALGTLGRYAESVGKLEQGLSIAPDYAAFLSNYTHVHFEWTEALGRAGRLADAAAELEHGHQVRPELPYFRQALLDVYRRWAAAEFAAGRADAGREVLVRAERTLGWSEDVHAAEIAVCNDHALRLLGQQRYAEAAAFLDRALAAFPGAAELRQSRAAAALRLTGGGS